MLTRIGDPIFVVRADERSGDGWKNTADVQNVSRNGGSGRKAFNGRSFNEFSLGTTRAGNTGSNSQFVGKTRVTIGGGAAKKGPQPPQMTKTGRRHYFLSYENRNDY